MLTFFRHLYLLLFDRSDQHMDGLHVAYSWEQIRHADCLVGSSQAATVDDFRPRRTLWEYKWSAIPVKRALLPEQVLKHLLASAWLTLSKPGFFGAPKTKGGAHCAPPSKNPVTLLRIHSSKLFLKACPKMNLLTQLWFPWKPWLGF